jgi:hypothetical protein
VRRHTPVAGSATNGAAISRNRLTTGLLLTRGRSDRKRDEGAITPAPVGFGLLTSPPLLDALPLFGRRAHHPAILTDTTDNSDSQHRLWADCVNHTWQG